LTSQSGAILWLSKSPGDSSPSILSYGLFSDRNATGHIVAIAARRVGLRSVPSIPRYGGYVQEGVRALVCARHRGRWDRSRLAALRCARRWGGRGADRSAQRRSGKWIGKRRVQTRFKSSRPDLICKMKSRPWLRKRLATGFEFVSVSAPRFPRPNRPSVNYSSIV
jgi:hypothetical protein